jgi:acylphosphatase
VIRKRIKVFGKVQGVCFRAYAKAEAKRIGVSGWVKNCVDSSVEIVVEGSVVAVEKMVSWSRGGSPYAYVENIDVQEEQYQGEYRGFKILH